MMLRRSIWLLSVFALYTSFIEGYTWTQAWVDKRILAKNELPKPVLEGLKKPGLTLVLQTKNELIITPVGNAYLQCFLINNTDTTVTIARSDATIADFHTEIYKNGVWVKFQEPLVGGCGNSDWQQKLQSQQVLSIQLEHTENGPIEVPFRIRYHYFDRLIYSNIIKVTIDQKNYDRVGD